MSLAYIKQGNLLEYIFSGEGNTSPIFFSRGFIVDITTGTQVLASIVTLQKNNVLAHYLEHQVNLARTVDVFYDTIYDSYWEDVQDFDVPESTLHGNLDRTFYRLIIKPGNYESADGDILTRLRLETEPVLNTNAGGTSQNLYNYGDILYATSPDTLSRLPANKTSAPLILTSIGNGESATQVGWAPAPILGTTLYYWTSTPADVVGYYRQTKLPVPTQAVITLSGVTNAQLISSFISDLGLPNVSQMAEGQYSCHLYASKTSGMKSIKIRAEAWEVSSLGIDIVKIVDVGTTPNLTGVNADYLLAATGLEHTFASTSSRVALKLFAVVQGFGTSPSISISIGGSTDGRSIFPSVTVDTTNFVTYENASANLNLGIRNITAANLSGTNTGDQTSVVGITGTKTQFDNACSDGNFLYSGDINQYTDEMAQDAVGAMIDTSLVYEDGTPLLTRAALTGAITASRGSNATSLGSFTTAQLNTALSDNEIATGGGTAIGSNTGDNATNTASNTYADGKVADAINDGQTTVAPSQNAVFDALALKQPLDTTLTALAALDAAAGVLKQTGADTFIKALIVNADVDANANIATTKLQQATIAQTKAQPANSDTLDVIVNKLVGLNNTGSSLAPITIANLPSGGAIGTAAATVDINNVFLINQTTTGQTITLPNPTNATLSQTITLSANSTASFIAYGSIIAAGRSGFFLWNGSGWGAIGSSSAETLATARTISMTGDIEYTSEAFDGSGNVTGTATLIDVTADIGTFTNANITINRKGQVVAASNGGGGGYYYSQCILLVYQPANIGGGDHAKFIQEVATFDPNGYITLDTTSAYNIGTNTASVGRVLLKAGRTYKITGYMSPLSNTGYMGFSVYNSDLAARVGTFGSAFAIGANAGGQNANATFVPSIAFVKPLIDTRYELRITSGGLIGALYTGDDNFGATSMTIESWS